VITKARPALLALAVLLSASAASADESRRLKWPEHYPKFRIAEYVATGAMTVAAAYIEFGITTSNEAKWKGPILFDDYVRFTTKPMRDSDVLDWVSDATLYAPQLWAIVLDPAVPLVAGEYRTFWEMSMINAEAFGITEILTRWPIKSAGRERPDALECETDRDYSKKCRRGPYASFPSGHTAFAFTGAAQVCAHHMGLKLYGNRAADITACVAAMALATTTAATRTLMDRHWFSDTFVGTAIGLGAGFGVPYLLHYRPLSVKTGDVRATLVPGGVGTGVGANVLGMF
jgi:membrane-associated phospholipid phosphatase